MGRSETSINRFCASAYGLDWLDLVNEKQALIKDLAMAFGKVTGKADFGFAMLVMLRHR